MFRHLSTAGQRPQSAGVQGVEPGPGAGRVGYRHRPRPGSVGGACHSQLHLPHTLPVLLEDGFEGGRGGGGRGRGGGEGDGGGGGGGWDRRGGFLLLTAAVTTSTGEHQVISLLPLIFPIPAKTNLLID